LISPEIIQKVTTVNLIDAEIMSLRKRLDSHEVVQGLQAGKKGDAGVAKMTARRNALTLKLRRELSGSAFHNSFKPTRGHDINTLMILNHLSELFGWCSTIQVPVMAEGINETPGTPGTRNEIVTAGVFAGGLGFSGTPEDDGTQDPNSEKWWIHNWNSTIVFPAAFSDGAISYNFAVDNDTIIYTAPANSGSVRVFVTAGTTSDVNQPIANWGTVGWPTDVALPKGFLTAGGSVPVSGTIQVKKGQKAALGLIFGVIVSVASGYCMFLPTSNIAVRLVPTQGQGIGPTLFGKIEYCFHPDWWTIALRQRMQMAIQK
jgi:hypothetical protein